MKSMSFLILLLSLLALASCDAEESAPVEGWRPEACAEKSSSSCGIDWFFTFPKSGFPTNAQIVINDKVVIDECSVSSQWAVAETGLVFEFELNNYANLDGTQKVNLQVFDRKDCNQSRSLFMSQMGQTYTIDSTGGTKKIKITKI